MLASPADFQAFAEATGTPYPATGEAKAQVLPVLLAWKQDQQQQQQQERGPNLLASALASAGAIGLGAGAFGIYQKLRRQGIEEPVAAEIAHRATATAQQAAAETQPAPPDFHRPPAAPTQRLQGQQLADQINITPAEIPLSAADPAGFTSGSASIPVTRKKDGRLLQLGALFPGNKKGTAAARGRGEYDLKSLWNDSTWGPLLQAANTPELQQALVAQVQEHDSRLASRIADAIGQRNGTGSFAATYVKSAADLPRPGSVPQDASFFVGDERRLVVPAANRNAWVDGSALGARKRLAATNQAAYGTASPNDIDPDGNATYISASGAKTDKGMLKESYLPPDENLNAALFVTEADLTDRARQLGAAFDEDGALTIEGEKGPITVKFGNPIAKTLINRPIRGSDLDATGELEPNPTGFSDREDATTKGMYESLPASSMNSKALQLKDSFGWDLIPASTQIREDGTVLQVPPHWEQRPYSGGVYTGKTFGEVSGAGELTDNDSFVKKGLGTPLPSAVQTYNKSLGRGEQLDNQGLINLAREYGVAPQDIVNAAGRFNGSLELTPNSGYTAPLAKPVGGHTNKDWLTQALSALQVTKPQDAHTVNHLLQSQDPTDRAQAARSWLGANPELVEVVTKDLSLSGLPATERISMVQEAINDAADDFHRAITWAKNTDPELAPRLEPGAKGFPSFDPFARAYVRKHVLGSSLELKNGAGDSAPVLNLPTAISELVGTEAVKRRTTPDVILNEMIGSAESPIDALWKLDGMLANAASTNLDEPYTVGSKLAERFWEAADDSSRAGRLKARLGATSNSRVIGNEGVALIDPTNAGSPVLPIAVKFGSNIKGAEGGTIKQDLDFSQELIAQVADPNASTVTTRSADELAGWLQQVDATRQQRLDNLRLPEGGILDQAQDQEFPTAAPQTSGQSRSHLAVKLGNEPRQFPINSRLDNLTTAANGAIARAQDDFKAGNLDQAGFDAIVGPAKAEIESIVAQQNDIDTLRVEGEQLLSRANVGAINATMSDSMGRGYVLGLDPRSGKAAVQPDISQTPISLDAITTDRGDEGIIDLDLQGDVSREASLESPAQDTVPQIAAGSPSTGTVAGPLNFKALGPGGPNAMADGEANQAIGRMRSLGYGPDYQEVTGTRLSTPDHLLRVARANLNRLEAQMDATTTPNTLVSSQEPSVNPALQARAGHLADYMDKLAAGGFRTSADGKRLVFANQRQVGSYNEPGDALIAARIGGLRKRGIA